MTDYDRAMRHIVADDVVIYKTKEYARFIFDPRNRPVRQGYVNGMVEVLRAKNFLPNYPITITPDWVVLDGQHRLVCARQLDLPIYYTITTNMDIMNVAETNANTHSWESADYLHYHASCGREDYVKLQAFLEQRPRLSLATAMTLGYGLAQKYGIYDTFRAGEYIWLDDGLPEKVADYALKFDDIYEFWYKKQFISALKSMFKHDDFDADKLLAQASRCPERLKEKMTTKTEALSTLQSIYNYRMQKRVAFYIP